MRTLERLKDWWLVGFMIALVLGDAVVLFALPDIAIILVATPSLGDVGTRAELSLRYSAPLWLPLAVGWESGSINRHLPALPLKVSFAR